MTSQSTWIPRLFLLKKKKRSVQIHHREKEGKKVTTTKTTRKFAAKTFKVNKCMTSATEILPPRESSDRRQSKRNLQSSGPTLFSVCACNATTEEKKKGKLVKCRTADKTKQKKFLGFTGAWTRTMPGPTISIKIDNLWSTCHAELGRKITLSGFCLFFKPRTPQEEQSTFGVHIEGSLTQTSTVNW